VVKPRIPLVSAASPDDDPTGVRALLSALPDPEPMPEHLVARINASLAAEQSQRAATTPSGSVTPLLATRRRRSGRVLLAIAGVAATVALVAVVGSNLFTRNEPAALTSSASKDATSGAREASPQAPMGAADKAAGGRAPTPSSIQIRSSDTRYTQGGFAAQAQSLRGATLDPDQGATLDRSRATAASPSSLGLAGTTRGLIECLSTIGAGGAQVVRADVAFYEGEPAMIIVATTDQVAVAYAVGLQCSPAHAALLHPGTPLQ